MNSIKIIDPPTKNEQSKPDFRDWKNTGIDQDVNRTFYDEKQEYLNKLKEEEDRENRRKTEKIEGRKSIIMNLAHIIKGQHLSE